MLIGTIAFYLVLLIVIGFVAYRFGQPTSEDYYLAGRGLGQFALIATLFATWMSTFAFLGSPGFYYSKGLAWYIPHGLLVVASPILLLFVGRRVATLGAECGAITPGDLIGWWFNSRLVAFLTGIICILALVPYATIQVLGIAKVVDVGSNGYLPFPVTVLGTAAIIGLYAFFGGVRAIVWTDILQAALFCVVMVVGGAVAILASSAEGITLSQALENHPTKFEIGDGAIGSVTTLAFIWTFGYILLPHMWQRMLMTKDPKILEKTVPWSSGLALFVIVVPSLIIGLLGPSIIGLVSDSDKVVPTLWQQHISPLYWLLMLATFAAGMSTMDSQMLTAASVVQRDLLGLTDKSPNQWLLRGTVVVLAVSFAALALSPQVSKNIILLASKGTGFAFLIAGPALFLIAGWRCRPSIASTGLVLGLVIVILGDVVSVLPTLPFGFGYSLLGAAVVLVVMLLGRVMILGQHGIAESN